MNGKLKTLVVRVSGIALLLSIAGCASTEFAPLPPKAQKQPVTTDPSAYNYLIGAGDQLDIFVWRNPEVSQEVTVRPDGMVTTPLVEDLKVSGKTPTEVARKLEEALGVYIKEPIVTVLVEGFQGPYSEQVRIIGEAGQPQAIPYRKDMSLLDVMISVGGLTEFADGNHASVVRVVDGAQQQFGVRIEDLIKDGDISANADILPGDIVIIPEAWF
ncbi:MAG: XrtA/PEP-CTERM system exopolysaccharide export protein [Motiliproteus sp.]